MVSRSRSLVTDGELRALIEAPPPVQWFGVTLRGQKIGHASLEMRTDSERIIVASSLSVSRAQNGASLSIHEERSYSRRAPYRLLSVVSRDEGADGKSEIRVARRADGMERRVIVDGKLQRSGGIPRSRETLADAASQSFARPRWLELGDRSVIVELEIESGSDRETSATVVESETVQLAGVATDRAVVELRREGQPATRTALGGSGLVLQATVGAFAFVAEDERTAKSNVIGLDLAASAISVGKTLGDAAGIERLELSLSGGDVSRLEIPRSPNQHVKAAGASLRVIIERGPGARVSEGERSEALTATANIDHRDPRIRALASRITADHRLPKARAKALNAWVFENLEKKLATDLGTASQVLNKRVGDCTEHTLLLVALARAAGLAAREVSGLVYLGDRARAFGWHAWAEIAIDGRWRRYDPSWGEAPANATHLTLGIGDDSRWISLIGALEIEILASHAR